MDDKTMSTKKGSASIRDEPLSTLGNKTMSLGDQTLPDLQSDPLERTRGYYKLITR
jgi:hypothetical protein